jgi:enoyl-CoA hydratase/carnithine racemase
MRVAAEDARFGLPEASRGLLAAAGGAYRLPRLLPAAIAAEMLATGSQIDAPRALHFGLINQMVPKGNAVAAAIELAGRVTVAAPLAVREALALARQAHEATDADLYRASRQANKRLWATEDFKEGPRAFVEKRAPRWTGR